MSDPYNVNRSVRRLLRTVLNISDENYIRPAQQAAPAGSVDQPFATVLITMLRKEGVDIISNRDDADVELNVQEVIEGNRRVMASVNFFRDGALEYAGRLPALLRSSNAIDKMRELGLGFINCSDPRNLTTLVDTNWEDRGQIDIEFYMIAREVISLPTYGEFPASIDLAIEKPDGTFYPPQTFEVIAP